MFTTARLNVRVLFWVKIENLTLRYNVTSAHADSCLHHFLSLWAASMWVYTFNFNIQEEMFDYNHTSLNICSWLFTRGLWLTLLSVKLQAN